MTSFQKIVPFPRSERSPAAGVPNRAHLPAEVPLLQHVLDAMPSMVMLLDPQQQLVLANRRLVEFSGAKGAEELVGLRPGEILKCIHALEGGDGCGTTPHCTVCGSHSAISNAQSGSQRTQICLMVRRGGEGTEPVELEVSAAPLEVSGQRFTLASYASAADRMHRERLEHILPQALVVTSEIEALTTVLRDETTPMSARRQAVGLIESASARLAGLVRAQTELAAAEAGRLPVLLQSVSARGLLLQALGEYVTSGTAGSAQIEPDSLSEDAVVKTDPALARRVLRETLLNALQAAPEGGVRAGIRISESHVDFEIRNPGEMPLAVQLQVFTRSFSTKARGRGYGAYFARLVAERYLGGSLSFRSAAGEGTTFTVRLPRAHGADAVEAAR